MTAAGTFHSPLQEPRVVEHDNHAIRKEHCRKQNAPFEVEPTWARRVTNFKVKEEP